MGKKVAILQSNYIPWKGYFDIINSVDLFIFYDDLQYTKNDWRNRNRIKTNYGVKWLTIPCGSSEQRLICEVKLNDHSWQETHWRILEINYKKAKYFHEYKNFFEDIYLGKQWDNLSELNQHVITRISRDILSIKTEFDDSRKYKLALKRGERVIELLKKSGADEYLSGPSAKNYLNEKDFEKEKIKLVWMDYSGYPEYNQLYPPFEHNVSIIDLIFNVGPDFPKYMNSYKLKIPSN